MAKTRSGGRITFKMAEGKPVVVWTGPARDDDVLDRRSAFEDFPNVRTPRELLDVLGRLRFPPVHMITVDDASEDVENPGLLLDAFGMDRTRTNMDHVRRLLAYSYTDVSSGPHGAIPLADFVAMVNDMRALLTVLLYAYGKGSCPAAALEMNTRDGFGFLYQWDQRHSAYGEFLSRFRYEEIQALELDREYIAEDIAKAVAAGERKLSRKSLAYMRRFSEQYVNAFLKGVSPCLSDGELLYVNEDGMLGDIYAYWAQRITEGNVCACPTCGKLVAHARKNQTFCSKNCGVKDYKKRKNDN